MIHVTPNDSRCPHASANTEGKASETERGRGEETVPGREGDSQNHSLLFGRSLQLEPMADIALAILRVVGEIHDVANGINENDRQACRLFERVTAIEPAVLAVKQGKRRFSSESLRQLLETVKDIRNFLDGYARTTKINRALKRKANAATFTDFGAALSEGMQALQLDVAVKAWADEDVSDRLEDLENMIEAMGKMELRRTNNHAEVMGALKALQNDERSALTAWVEIDFDKDLNFEGSFRLGSGGFGEVRTAKWNGSHVAVKHLLVDGLHRDDIRALRKEIRIHSSLHFDHVVHLYAASTIAPHLCLVVELASEGSLLQYLRATSEPLEHAMQAVFLFDIAKGMLFLHKKGILHRDLKSANVLVFANLRLKLCDFGLSKIKAESSSRSKAGGVGSTEWMSPEEMDGGSATELTDVYSFGVVCFEIATRIQPFKGKRSAQVIGAVRYREERPKVPEGASASPDVVPLMEQCWKQDPAQRPDGFVPVVEALASVVRRVGDPRSSDGLTAGDAAPPSGEGTEFFSAQQSLPATTSIADGFTGERAGSADFHPSQTVAGVASVAGRLGSEETSGGNGASSAAAHEKSAGDVELGHRVELGHAVLAAAQELAYQSPVPGISKVAAGVSIMANLNNRESDRAACESRIIQCRSVVTVLERAEKVVAKGGDTAGEAMRALIEDLHDAIFDLVELIKTFQSKSKLSKLLLSKVFKRRLDEQDAVLDRAVNRLLLGLQVQVGVDNVRAVEDSVRAVEDDVSSVNMTV